MDKQLVTEKLLEFCHRSYPNLDWNYSYFHGHQTPTYYHPHSYNVVALIVGSCSLFKLELEICSDGEGWEGIKGWCTLNSLDWVGEFIVFLSCGKKSELCFYTETVDKWSVEHWLLCKQIQKIMLDIYTFILDEIQE